MMSQELILPTHHSRLRVFLTHSALIILMLYQWDLKVVREWNDRQVHFQGRITQEGKGIQKVLMKACAV
jgi:hypothetical protein